MQKCRAAGFEIIVLFVTTISAAINVARIAGRVRSGGHNVPEDRIVSRYERSMTLLPRIVEESDRAFVYENSGEEPVIFAFLNNSFLPMAQPLPIYLQERLLTLLSRRRAERITIAENLGPIDLPDIEKGQYAGNLRWLSENYAVQATPTGMMRHDRLLLTETVSVGETATVISSEGLARLA
jgi:hypothetical protein